MAHKSTALKIVAALAVVVVLIGAVLVIRAAGAPKTSSWARPAQSPDAVAPHPRGGAVSVVVSTPAEMSDPGNGGDTLRALTLPKLFDAQPNRTWRASLVEPGTDSAAKDGKSAMFRLRNAKWSDGSTVTSVDLARTADSRFVKKVQGPDKKGYVTVHFTQKLPGWRHLWSGSDSVTPPKPGLTSGAFNIKSITSGLETVLTRNETAYANVPFLDEVRLVVVPDSALARQLLAAGEVDVLAPPIDTSRTPALRKIDGVNVNVAEITGVWTALRFGQTMGDIRRSTLSGAIPRGQFTAAFLKDEGKELDGFDSPVWSKSAPTGTEKIDGNSLKFVMPAEEPLGNVLGKAVQHAAESRGAKVSVQTTTYSDVHQAATNRSYDVLFDTGQTGPDVCWLCTFSGVDDALAERADAGDKAAARHLQAKARDSAVFLPLWESRYVVASRSAAVRGVTANGFATGVAWGAATWWRP